MILPEPDRQLGDPIPKASDHSESPSLLQFQALRLARLCAINAALAETIAPLVFLEVLR
jgi:hypothetical protein